MRKRLAAACAAVLVGLAPAGALPFASFAGAAACSVVEGRAQRLAAEPRQEPVQKAARLAVEALCDVVQPVVIWRQPSGPAPSQAPPARA